MFLLNTHVRALRRKSKSPNVLSFHVISFLFWVSDILLFSPRISMSSPLTLYFNTWNVSMCMASLENHPVVVEICPPLLRSPKSFKL